MTNRKITKLFAVVALAASTPAAASPDKPTASEQTVRPRTLPNGRPACGNTMSKGPRRPCETAREPTSVTPVIARTTPTQSMERVAIVFAKLRALFGVTEQTVKTPAAAPRRLRNGSPANGNVARRSAPPPEPEQPTTPPPSTTN